MGPDKIIILGILVLLLFGAKRIPEVLGSVGKGIREFKRNINDVERQIKEPEADVRSVDTRASDRLAAGDMNTTGAAREESRPEPKRLI